MIEIKCESAPILASSLNRCFSNTARVSSLIGVYKECQNADILRICVSFLHATIEDCMRNLLFFSLTKNQSRELLNQVPLKGISNTGRPEKFFLGELLRFEEETVKSIIEESVSEYVNRITFNGTTDIMNWISKLNLDDSEIVPLLSDLDKLITRRHAIVHNSDFSVNRSLLSADIIVQHGPEDTFDLTPINADIVEEWLATTSRFFMALIPLFLTNGEEIKFTNVL